MIIFSPGPANISERVRRALTLPDICHRDAEFSGLLSEIRKILLEVCGVSEEYKSIVFGGSGTLAIEGVLSAFGGWDKKILVISNGVYGERAAAICRLYGIGVEEIRLPWGKMPDLNELENRLKESVIGAVYLVHHETTTGLLNPLKEASLLAKKNSKLMLVDGVSSIAGETLDIENWGVDAISGSANKCIRGVPGVSFAIVSTKYLSVVARCKSRSFYADLSRYLQAEEKAEPLFTPAVQVFYAFRQALRELLKEGVSARVKQYQRITGILRAGLKKLKIRFYIPEEDMSNTMTVVYLPQGYDYMTLHKSCKEKGYVIYASQGDLEKKTFRLGIVGLISEKDIKRFTKVLSGILKK